MPALQIAALPSPSATALPQGFWHQRPGAWLRILWLLALTLTCTSTWASGQWQRFAPAADLLQGKALQSGTGLIVELPALSENGGAVPLSIVFRADLPAGDALAAIHVLATANPKPEIISVQFQDARVLPELSTRIRLSESQNVIVIALSREGRAWVAERAVRVTVSGCLMPGETVTADAVQMRNPRVAVARTAGGKSAEIRALVQHPMETGLRAGADGKPVPQNLVERLVLALDGQDALTVRFYTGTAANPYVRLQAHAGQAASAQLTWQDQAGRSLSETRPLPAG